MIPGSHPRTNRKKYLDQSVIPLFAASEPKFLDLKLNFLAFEYFYEIFMQQSLTLHNLHFIVDKYLF
jgi:hypothetical protein